MFNQNEQRREISVIWFRHGLRLHDNPAFLNAVKNAKCIYPVFIFDGESAGTKNIGYNRLRFLLECLQDVDDHLKIYGGRLYLFQGDPVTIFTRMWQELCITKIAFEQDCEPIWKLRDDRVKNLCSELGIKCREYVSHTLWDPKLVIKTNGGIPPLTYLMFLHTVSVIGLPPKPARDVDFSRVKFGQLPDILREEFKILDMVPSPEFFGKEGSSEGRIVLWRGGERHALRHLEDRLKIEAQAFREGVYLTNQMRPDLLATPTSQSAALRHGCLSVRRFYWCIHNLFCRIHPGVTMPPHTITGQFIWREYFYTMSVDNPHYAEMTPNPICLNINWKGPKDHKFHEHLEAWKQGMTGYPFIDATMRQLKQEGWTHHIGRNATACFLTRGDLWISWEEGLQHFLHYLLDADWSVCAGNWMWVSSSAFEQLLDCSLCICPVSFGKRFDPSGLFAKQYIPELRDFPVEYIYEPWLAPLEVQKHANCIIGQHYPDRIVIHKTESSINKKRMEDIRRVMVSNIPHCCPSDPEEVRRFLWLHESHNDHICVK